MPRKLRKSAGVTREDIEMLESLPPAISSPETSSLMIDIAVCENQNVAAAAPKRRGRPPKRSIDDVTTSAISECKANTEDAKKLKTAHNIEELHSDIDVGDKQPSSNQKLDTKNSSTRRRSSRMHPDTDNKSAEVVCHEHVNVVSGEVSYEHLSAAPGELDDRIVEKMEKVADNDNALTLQDDPKTNLNQLDIVFDASDRDGIALVSTLSSNNIICEIDSNTHKTDVLTQSNVNSHASISSYSTDVSVHKSLNDINLPLGDSDTIVQSDEKDHSLARSSSDSGLLRASSGFVVEIPREEDFQPDYESDEEFEGDIGALHEEPQTELSSVSCQSPALALSNTLLSNAVSSDPSKVLQSTLTSVSVSETGLDSANKESDAKLVKTGTNNKISGSSCPIEASTGNLPKTASKANIAVNKVSVTNANTVNKPINSAAISSNKTVGATVANTKISVNLASKAANSKISSSTTNSSAITATNSSIISKISSSSVTVISSTAGKPTNLSVASKTINASTASKPANSNTACKTASVSTVGIPTNNTGMACNVTVSNLQTLNSISKPANTSSTSANKVVATKSVTAVPDQPIASANKIVRAKSVTAVLGQPITSTNKIVTTKNVTAVPGPPVTSASKIVTKKVVTAVPGQFTEANEPAQESAVSVTQKSSVATVSVSKASSVTIVGTSKENLTANQVSKSTSANTQVLCKPANITLSSTNNETMTVSESTSVGMISACTTLATAINVCSKNSSSNVVSNNLIVAQGSSVNIIKVTNTGANSTVSSSPLTSVANPPPTRVINPPPARTTNPPLVRANNPPPARVTNPAPAKVTNPAPSRVTNPAPARVANPSPARVANPAPARGTNPAPARGTNPAPARGTNPSPARVANPSPTRVTNPSPARVTDSLPANVTNPPTAKASNSFPATTSDCTASALSASTLVATSSLSNIANPLTAKFASPSPARMANPSPARVIASSSPARVVNSSPARVVSPSPARIVSPSPARVVSPSSARAASPSPARVASPSPTKVVSPSPTKVGSPTPARAVGPSPARLNSSSVRAATPSSAGVVSPSSVRVVGPSPAKIINSSPTRASNPSPARTTSPSPVRAANLLQAKSDGQMTNKVANLLPAKVAVSSQSKVESQSQAKGNEQFDVESLAQAKTGSQSQDQVNENLQANVVGQLQTIDKCQLQASVDSQLLANVECHLTKDIQSQVEIDGLLQTQDNSVLQTKVEVPLPASIAGPLQERIIPLQTRVSGTSVVKTTFPLQANVAGLSQASVAVQSQAKVTGLSQTRTAGPSKPRVVDPLQNKVTSPSQTRVAAPSPTSIAVPAPATVADPAETKGATPWQAQVTSLLQTSIASSLQAGAAELFQASVLDAVQKSSVNTSPGIAAETLLVTSSNSSQAIISDQPQKNIVAVTQVTTLSPLRALNPPAARVANPGLSQPSSICLSNANVATLMPAIVTRPPSRVSASPLTKMSTPSPTKVTNLSTTKPISSQARASAPSKNIAVLSLKALATSSATSCVMQASHCVKIASAMAVRDANLSHSEPKPSIATVVTPSSDKTSTMSNLPPTKGYAPPSNITLSTETSSSSSVESVLSYVKQTSAFVKTASAMSARGANLSHSEPKPSTATVVTPSADKTTTMSNIPPTNGNTPSSNVITPSTETSNSSSADMQTNTFVKTVNAMSTRDVNLSNSETKPSAATAVTHSADKTTKMSNIPPAKGNALSSNITIPSTGAPSSSSTKSAASLFVQTSASMKAASSLATIGANLSHAESTGSSSSVDTLSETLISVTASSVSISNLSLEVGISFGTSTSTLVSEKSCTEISHDKLSKPTSAKTTGLLPVKSSNQLATKIIKPLPSKASNSLSTRPSKLSSAQETSMSLVSDSASCKNISNSKSEKVMKESIINATEMLSTEVSNAVPKISEPGSEKTSETNNLMTSFSCPTTVIQSMQVPELTMTTASGSHISVLPEKSNVDNVTKQDVTMESASFASADFVVVSGDTTNTTSQSSSIHTSETNYILSSNNRRRKWAQNAGSLSAASKRFKLVREAALNYSGENVADDAATNSSTVFADNQDLHSTALKDDYCVDESTSSSSDRNAAASNEIEIIYSSDETYEDVLNPFVFEDITVTRDLTSYDSVPHGKKVLLSSRKEFESLNLANEETGVILGGGLEEFDPHALRVEIPREALADESDNALWIFDAVDRLDDVYYQSKKDFDLRADDDGKRKSGKISTVKTNSVANALASSGELLISASGNSDEYGKVVIENETEEDDETVLKVGDPEEWEVFQPVAPFSRTVLNTDISDGDTLVQLNLPEDVFQSNDEIIEDDYQVSSKLNDSKLESQATDNLVTSKAANAYPSDLYRPAKDSEIVAMKRGITESIIGGQVDQIAKIYQIAVRDHIKNGGCDSVFPEVFFGYGANLAMKYFRIFVNALRVATNDELTITDKNSIVALGVSLMLLCEKKNQLGEAFQFVQNIWELGFAYSDGLVDGLMRSDFFSLMIDICIKVKNHKFAIEILETSDWLSGKVFSMNQESSTKLYSSMLSLLSELLKQFNIKCTQELFTTSLKVMRFLIINSPQNDKDRGVERATALCNRLVLIALDKGVASVCMEMFQVFEQYKSTISLKFDILRRIVSFFAELATKVSDYMPVLLQAVAYATRYKLYPEQRSFSNKKGGTVFLWNCLTHVEMFLIIYTHLRFLVDFIIKKQSLPNVKIQFCKLPQWPILVDTYGKQTNETIGRDRLVSVLKMCFSQPMCWSEHNGTFTLSHKSLQSCIEDIDRRIKNMIELVPLCLFGETPRQFESNRAALPDLTSSVRVANVPALFEDRRVISMDIDNSFSDTVIETISEPLIKGPLLPTPGIAELPSALSEIDRRKHAQANRLVEDKLSHNITNEHRQVLPNMPVKRKQSTTEHRPLPKVKPSLLGTHESSEKLNQNESVRHSSKTSWEGFRKSEWPIKKADESRNKNEPFSKNDQIFNPPNESCGHLLPVERRENRSQQVTASQHRPMNDDNFYERETFRDALLPTRNILNMQSSSGRLLESGEFGLESYATRQEQPVDSSKKYPDFRTNAFQSESKLIGINSGIDSNYRLAYEGDKQSWTTREENKKSWPQTSKLVDDDVVFSSYGNKLNLRNSKIGPYENNPMKGTSDSFFNQDQVRVPPTDHKTALLKHASILKPVGPLQPLIRSTREPISSVSNLSRLTDSYARPPQPENYSFESATRARDNLPLIANTPYQSDLSVRPTGFLPSTISAQSLARSHLAAASAGRPSAPILLKPALLASERHINTPAGYNVTPSSMAQLFSFQRPSVPLIQTSLKPVDNQMTARTAYDRNVMQPADSRMSGKAQEMDFMPSMRSTTTYVDLQSSSRYLDSLPIQSSIKMDAPSRSVLNTSSQFGSSSLESTRNSTFDEDIYNSSRMYSQNSESQLSYNKYSDNALFNSGQAKYGKQFPERHSNDTNSYNPSNDIRQPRQLQGVPPSRQSAYTSHENVWRDERINDQSTKNSYINDASPYDPAVPTDVDERSTYLNVYTNDLLYNRVFERLKLHINKGNVFREDHASFANHLTAEIGLKMNIDRNSRFPLTNSDIQYIYDEVDSSFSTS